MTDPKQPDDGASVPVPIEPPVRAPDGRFLPGHRQPGPGRSPGLNFITIARKRSEARGTTLEHEVGEVFDMMMGKALKGDLVAARLIIDRVTEGIKLTANRETGAMQLTITTGVPSMIDDVEDLLS